MEDGKDDSKGEANAFEVLKSGALLTPQRCELSKVSVCSQEECLNDKIEEIFGFTLNRERVNKGRYHLKHLVSDLTSRRALLLLNWDNLENAILERLGIYGSGETSSEQSFNRLDYLCKCFKRSCLNSSLSATNHEVVVTTAAEVTTECRKWILRYAVAYLLEPEVFNSRQNADLEKYELILLAQSSKDVEAFLAAIRAKLKPDEYENAFAPVLLVIQGKLKLYSLLVTDQDYVDASLVLSYFTSDEHLAEVLVNSPNFLPSGDLSTATGESYSTNTLLGLMFGAVCTHTKTSTPVYFNVSVQSPNDFAGITNSIRSSLGSIYDRVVQSFKRLLVHPRFKEPLLLWWFFCLNSHSSRSKLGATLFLANQPQTSDGFFVNLCYVALKIFAPIACDWSKVISKVSYDYCLHKPHILCDTKGRSYEFSFEKETMLLPQTDGNLSEEQVTANSFNFPTIWYYFTHKALQTGLVPSFERYLSLMQTLNEIQSELSFSLTDNNPKQMLKMRMEALLGEQLCIKAQLLNPSLVDMLIEFISATCVHLLNAINCRISSTLEIEHPTALLEDKVGPAVFKWMPEFILDQAATCITHLVQFSPECVSQSEDRIFSIVLCFSIFLGSNYYVRNPHLRAKLAQSLHAIMMSSHNDVSLPYSSNDSIRSLFQRNKALSKILPKQLIKLFVDIEFTGHAHEFQQKFSYRYHMYKILDYIWELPEFVATIKLISEEAEQSLTDSVPLFLRFINLLVNDATYLLDEALTHLCKIHDLEQERNSRKWETLTKEALQEKEQMLHSTRKTVEGYNLLSRDTVHALDLLTSEFPRPFLSSAMVDRIASMLNYFLRHLVGEKKKDLKVQDMDKLHFDPKLLVSIICKIFVNLHTNDDRLCEAVVEDKRSFSEDLWDLALGVLTYIRADISLIDRFISFKHRVLLIHQKTIESNIDESEIPEEFLDPIACSLIQDPVLLPSSKVIVDRTTITKHLLSDESDPFNRSHLTVDMLVPLPELSNRIQEWLSERKQK